MSQERPVSPKAKSRDGSLGRSDPFMLGLRSPPVSRERLMPPIPSRFGIPMPSSPAEYPFALDPRPTTSPNEVARSAAYVFRPSGPNSGLEPVDAISPPMAPPQPHAGLTHPLGFNRRERHFVSPAREAGLAPSPHYMQNGRRGSTWRRQTNLGMLFAAPPLPGAVVRRSVLYSTDEDEKEEKQQASGTQRKNVNGSTSGGELGSSPDTSGDEGVRRERRQREGPPELRLPLPNKRGGDTLDKGQP